jgi:transcriptional regulator with XRE-family HTH domain
VIYFRETLMNISDRLRELREVRNLSQKIIEQRTGLLCSYISRVENGHIAPSIETLEKMARGLEVSMYRLFYDDEERPQIPKAAKSNDSDWAGRGQGAAYLARLRRSLRQMSDEDRSLLLHLVHKMARAKRVAATEAGKSRAGD